MKFYNNIFASTYKYYSRYKTEAPLFSSICVVTVCQMVFLFLIIILLKVFKVIDLFGMLPSKYYFIPVLALWIFLLYKYYTKDKAEEIMIRYEKKPLSERRLWGVITILTFIAPIIIIALLLNK
jgi:archaellum biogenesis protein FlaJ (TadC family)